jgi:hypothetical protein
MLEVFSTKWWDYKTALTFINRAMKRVLPEECELVSV